MSGAADGSLPRKNCADRPWLSIAVRSAAAGWLASASACRIAGSCSSAVAKLGSVPAAEVTAASACSCLRLAVRIGRNASSSACRLAWTGSDEAAYASYSGCSSG